MGRASLLVAFFFLCIASIARGDDGEGAESRLEEAESEGSRAEREVDDAGATTAEASGDERSANGDGEEKRPAQSLESQQRSGAPAERALLGSLESFFGKEPDRIESPDGPKDASFEESEGAASALSEADDRMDNSDAEARPIDLFAEDALLRAVRAAAPEIASEAAPQPTAKRPLLVEDRFRYGNLWLIPRGVLSGVAIPLSIPYWSPHEITRMVATTATVTTMMLPLGPSLDVRIYRAMQSARTPFLDALFPKIYTIPMTLGIAAYTTILSAGFYFFKRPRLREYVSLMLEALGIVQFYHVSLKLLIGREGPYQGVGEGRVFGPTRVFFPGGTPSGHTASAFAILVTAAEYYGTWPIRILAYVGASYMATSFAYNNQHFASDVIWGAMMGDTVARWVVRHRSSANRGPSLRPKLQASPMVVPGGAGFSLSLSGGGFL